MRHYNRQHAVLTASRALCGGAQLESGEELIALRDGVVPDGSGNGRGGHLGRMACPAPNELRFQSVNALQPRSTVLPAVPWVLPSTAPVVRVGAPVVVLIVNGLNLVALASHDPDGDALLTTIISLPRNGTLVDARGAVVANGTVIDDTARRHSQRVWYVPHAAAFADGSWSQDTFEYAVSDGGAAHSVGLVELMRHRLPTPQQRALRLNEDSLATLALARPYVASRSKTTRNVRVRITRLPPRGTLYQACFAANGDGTYASVCSYDDPQPTVGVHHCHRHDAHQRSWHRALPARSQQLWHAVRLVRIRVRRR
jgi:hypothetical protein